MGRMGTDMSVEWMVVCGGVDLRAEANVLDRGWCPCTTGLVFIDEDRPGPVIFASGGFGTDFTLNSMLTTGMAFLFMRLVLDRIRSPGKYRRRVRVVERSFAHLCWFFANVGPEVVFGTDVRTTEQSHTHTTLLVLLSVCRYI